MTLYCENAAAEVLFSLTGGREGRIVSYNPPVEVTTASGILRSVFTQYETNYSDDGNQNTTYTDIDTVFLEIPRMSANENVWSGNFQAGDFIYETKQEYQQFTPDNRVLYKRTLERTDARTNQKKIIY
ncbi:hypothetical protein [Tolypothrix sp. VBCCA 56010]|uniref:hypothetical protein n=1 Tax=Tolypothrix sp. VBCCA 56010 TaxID=3137731 RepID=UPI003D7D600B